MQHIIKNRPLTAAYIVMALGFTVAFVANNYDSEWDEHRRCVTEQKWGAALQSVIIKSFEDGGIEFDTLTTFDALPVEVKDFFLEIQSLSKNGSQDARVEGLLELVPIPRCEKPELLR